MKSRRRVNFYEAGSGQEVMRVDWFTLLFKVTRINQRLGQLLFVASVNWCDEAHSQAPRFALKLTRELFVISISFPNLLFDHSSLSRFAQAVIGLLLLTRRLNQPKPSNRLIVSPGPHSRDYFFCETFTSIRSLPFAVLTRARESDGAACPNI